MKNNLLLLAILSLFCVSGSVFAMYTLPEEEDPYANTKPSSGSGTRDYR